MSTNEKAQGLTNRDVSSFLKKNKSATIAGAVGLGIVVSVLDNEDDDIGSSIGKGIKAGVVGELASYGARLGISYLDKEDIEISDLFRGKTLQDHVKEEVGKRSKEKRADADAKRKITSKGAKLGTAAKVVAGIVGVATVVDIARKLHDNHEAERLKAEQEWDMKQKEKERKRRQKQESYGYLQQGEILFDLFGSRTGHYKMGNAKFQ